MEALAREQILLPIDVPVHADLQPGSVPEHKQWAATLLSVWVQTYNTKLLDKADLPKTYRDLLDPKWKGKLGIEAKDQDWFASVVDVMGGGETGLKFFRDLVATNGISVRLGHTLLSNMFLSGECRWRSPSTLRAGKEEARRWTGSRWNRRLPAPTRWEWRATPRIRTRRSCSTNIYWARTRSSPS
jgi:hypothetical protein